jgi:hypothetical protein
MRKPHDSVSGAVDLLGGLAAPVVSVSDLEIWKHLFTPTVRAILGRVTEPGKPQLLETEAGLFQGDSVSNLNNHKLFGGQNGYVRYPYVETIHRTSFGYFVVKRDPIKFVAYGYLGDIFKGQAEMIYMVALRDRRFDGTPRANDFPLLGFPMDDPQFNSPFAQSTGVEDTCYAFLPGTKISAGNRDDQEYEDFVSAPYAFLGDPDRFLAHFRRVWKSNRAPGQLGAPIPDVSKLILPAVNALARRHGYDFIYGSVNHYHVGMWEIVKAKRQFRYDRDAKVMADLTAALQRLGQSVKMTRTQGPWVCAVNQLPVDKIPPELYLGGPKWEYTNLDQRYLWLYNPLNRKAAKLAAAASK